MRRLVVSDLALRLPARNLFGGVSFAVDAGESVAVMGPSGSGKTSLLNCLSGIAVPSHGTVAIDGTLVSRLSAAHRAAFRLRTVGLVFQFGELLPELTVAENVALPLRLQGRRRAEAAAAAVAMLDRFGLADRGGDHPEVLSGGEVQRVGIARALVHGPAVVLADEPTGALDEANATALMDILVGQARDLGTTVVIATHDPLVADRVGRVLRFGGGTVGEASWAGGREQRLTGGSGR